jgi:aryl-alcohol dehydrogenase-like predicted oxidoreductase
MLPKRPFGASGISHSVLIFGSMRLDPSRLSLSDACALLRFLSDAGVNAYHSSHEYEAHRFFCEVLNRVKPCNAVHVVKIGEPHFDERRFRRNRFVRLVEQELKALRTDRLDIVQWLLRATPNIDDVRLPLLRDCIAEVEDTFTSLRHEGKVQALAVFPYTPAVIEFCLNRPSCAGLVSYFNTAETDIMPYLEGMESRGQGMLAIRPLAAGRLLDATDPAGQNFADLCAAKSVPVEDKAKFAIRWPLTHPAVSGVILSVTSMAHAAEAVEALAAAQQVVGTTSESI